MNINTLTNSFVRLVLTALVGQSASTGFSASTNIVASDTFISAYQLLGGGPPNDRNFGDAPYLYSAGSPNFTAYWYPLLKFDLTSLTNREVVGTPRVEVFIYAGHPAGDGRTRPVSVHQVLIPWDASTVTWNTFGASPGVQWGVDVGSSLAVQDIVWPGTGPRLISWDLPPSVVQNWIDKSASSHGLLLNCQDTRDQSDMLFASLENTDQYPAARLVLDTKPRAPRASIRVSQVEICWDTMSSNFWYQVQYKSTLTTNQWVPLNANWLQGDGNVNCIVDAVLAAQYQRFYQIAVTNTPPQF